MILTSILVILSVFNLYTFSFAEEPARSEVVDLKMLLDYKIELRGDSYSNEENRMKSHGLMRNRDRSIDLESMSSSNPGLPATDYQGYLNYNRVDINSSPRELINEIRYDFSSKKERGASLSTLMEVPSGFKGWFMVGSAFLTNLVMHEFGHEVVAHYVGAEGTSLNFFKKDGGDFFLGTSHVDRIDSNSTLPYTMGGEFFADLTFEHALREYRKKPSTYNQSLLVSSGTDFLWYCFYAFYLANENPSYDPITISKETGISHDMLFSVALAKTMLNAYRVYSGEDPVIPYFTVDRQAIQLNFMIPFEIDELAYKVMGRDRL